MLRSEMSSWSRVACSRYSRESTLSGASRKASSRAALAFAQSNRPFLRIGQTPAATIKSPSVEPVFALRDVVVRTDRPFSPPPQHGAIPGIQFADAERLGQEVVGTEFESDHTVNFIAGTTLSE